MANDPSETRRIEAKLDALLALTAYSVAVAERERRRRNRSIGDRLWDML